MSRVAGMLLTGGTSRRMGVDKATMLVDGERAAPRLAGLLLSVADPVVEVGPGHTTLGAVAEQPSGSGPVVAVAAGWRALRRTGGRRPVLTLACDLPLMTRGLLRWLADRPGDGSVVPVVTGRPQPLCARWSPADLDRMDGLVAAGARAFKTMYQALDVSFADEDEWRAAARPADFSDTDSPEDLQRLGLAMGPAPGRSPVGVVSGAGGPARDGRGIHERGA